MSIHEAKMPKWSIPENLQDLNAADSPDGDGMWERVGVRYPTHSGSSSVLR
jgi:hypothetical protein